MSETDLKSLDDARRLIHEEEDRRARDGRVQRRAMVVKRITWIILLAAAFLAYYLLDKMSEAVSLLR